MFTTLEVGDAFAKPKQVDGFSLVYRVIVSSKVAVLQLETNQGYSTKYF